MIRNESIILAEGIALGLTAPVQYGPVIQGLMEVSVGGAAYGDNYRQQIVDVTSENDAHNQVMEDTSTRLAEIIRESFGQIRDFAAPFSQALTQALEDQWIEASFQEAGFRELHAEFVCVEHPFFNSLVYPTAVKNTAMSFSSINLGIIDRVAFSAPSREELLAWLNTTHPDVMHIMNDPEACPVSAFNNLTDISRLEEMFVSRGNRTVDFTEVKKLDLKTLFQMYVILSKMSASADPVKWLTNGSLTEYREFVNLLWNGLTAHLLRVKELCEVYRKRGIAVLESKPVTLRTIDVNDGLARLAYRTLNGKVTVLYTEHAIEQLTKSEHTLRDWLVARYFGRLTNGPSSVTDLGLLQGNELGRLCGQYYGQVRQALEKNRGLVFEQIFRTTLDQFLAKNPVIVEYLKAQNDKDMPTTAVLAKMEADYKWGYRIAGYAAEFTDISTAVANSGVATAFLRAIGCDLAASILAGTEYQCEEDSVLDKRKRLHYSVISQITRKLLGK